MWVILLFGFFLLLSLVAFIVVLSSFLAFVVTRVPFVPTPYLDIQTIAERIPITESDTVYDLGSGNGKVSFMLADLTGAQTVGFEAMLWAHWYASIKKILSRSKARFVLGNFFNHNWAEATVIYCYLYPPLMQQIGEKVLMECRTGTRVVVRDFAIPNLRQVDYFRTDGNHKIFVYQI